MATQSSALRQLSPLARQGRAADEGRRRLPVRARLCPHVPRGKHQLDLLDCFPGDFRVCPSLNYPEPDLRLRPDLLPDRHRQGELQRSKLKTQAIALAISQSLGQLRTQLPHQRRQLNPAHVTTPIPLLPQLRSSPQPGSFRYPPCGCLTLAGMLRLGSPTATPLPITWRCCKPRSPPP